MSALVSIIVPAYNAKKTVGRLIRCVREQSYKELEIILVNDGSKDNTSEIMHMAAAEDDRIVVIDQENTGVGGARNVGIERAHGKYICFYDADDAVPSRAVSRMVRVARINHADMVIGMVKFMDKEQKRVTVSTERLGNTERIGKYNKSLIGTLSIWNKLFRRDIIEKYDIRFNDTKRGEDSVFFFEYWSKCKRISGCPYVVYHYERRKIRGKRSLSQKVTFQALEQMNSNYKTMLSIIDSSIEKDISEMSENGEDPEEIRTRTEHCRAFRSLLCRKAVGTLVNKYYRELSDPSEKKVGRVEAIIRRYKKEMADEDWKRVLEENPDIISDEGVLLNIFREEAEENNENTD